MALEDIVITEILLEKILSPCVTVVPIVPKLSPCFWVLLLDFLVFLCPVHTLWSKRQNIYVYVHWPPLQSHFQSDFHKKWKTWADICRYTKCKPQMDCRQHISLSMTWHSCIGTEALLNQLENALSRCLHCQWRNFRPFISLPVSSTYTFHSAAYSVSSRDRAGITSIGWAEPKRRFGAAFSNKNHLSPCLKH